MNFCDIFYHIHFTTSQRSWGRVMFSQVSVCPQRAGYPWSHVPSGGGHSWSLVPYGRCWYPWFHVPLGVDSYPPPPSWTYPPSLNMLTPWIYPLPWTYPLPLTCALPSGHANPHPGRTHPNMPTQLVLTSSGGH